MIAFLTADNLNVTHGFYTRKGGVSEGIYKGLNLGRGSKDNPDHVQKNRKMVINEIGAKSLCTLYQIHSDKVKTVTEPWPAENAPQADAMVTDKAGIALGILTADCVPVLFADEKAKVIGAAHAGWKGTIDGVLENTIVAMEALGADRAAIEAAIGPAICQRSYQIDTFFHADLTDKDPNSKPFFSRDPNSSTHYYFDLKAYVHDRLERAGLTDLDMLPDDTYQQESQFYSYRRSCHNKESDYGRQISAIML